MIYVASPFTDPNPLVEEKRYHQALDYTNGLLNKGYVAFSPIVYGYQFHRKHGRSGDYETWLQLNNTMLFSAEEMHILKIPGWISSKGIAHEIQFAYRHDVPTKYVEV